MEKKHIIILIITLSSCFLLLLIFFLICICCKKKESFKNKSWDKEANNSEFKENNIIVEEIETKGDFIKFQGGEDLTCFDILDAPGEVIGKSSFGTLYRANLLSDSVLLLRFLRPACTIGKVQDVMLVVQLLGSTRHPNLVPLCGFYSGPRGEKLLVHPFYRTGNLAQFIRGNFSSSFYYYYFYFLCA